MIYTLRRYHENEKRNEEKCLADCEEALYSAFGSVYAGILYRGGVYHEFHAKHLQREGTAVDKALEGN